LSSRQKCPVVKVLYQGLSARFGNL